MSLTEDDLVKLRDAIEDLYYFEFVVDDIPVRGFIGHLEESGFLPHSHKVLLWSHLHFNIEYNDEEKKIIYANVTTQDSQPVNLDDAVAPFDLTFTYSVKWIKTEYVVFRMFDRCLIAPNLIAFPCLSSYQHQVQRAKQTSSRYELLPQNSRSKNLIEKSQNLCA